MKSNKLMINILSYYYLLLLVPLGIFQPHFSGADPLDNWHWRNPVPTGNNLTAIAYGNGIFVAVGAAGTILTSPDGVTWTQRTSGVSSQPWPDAFSPFQVSSQLQAVTYGNGAFVVVGENGTILTSQDGMTWTKRVSGITSTLYGVTFGNDIFVAVGGNSYHSYDCFCPCPEPPCRNCCPTGGCCPAIILTSPDGINWTSKILGSVEFGLTGVTYGNGIFIAFDPFDSIFISSDGVDWSSSPGLLKALTYGGGIFVGIGSDNTVQTSPDGVKWTTRTSQDAYITLYAITYGNGTFVAVGSNTILTSPDGETWIKRISSVAGDYYYLKIFEGVTYGNGTFVVVGENGTILTSPDGVTWTARTSRVTSESLRAVAYGDGTFVAVGDGSSGSGVGGIIVSSLDGATWILRSSGKSSGISCDLYAVAYGNGIFVATGYDYWKGHGGILVSPDGITWTTTVSPKHGLSGVIYGNGTFVAVGYDTILTSLDGVIWTEESSVDAALNAVTYGNGTFVAVGSCGSSDCITILTSQDAVNWTRRAGPTSSFLGITYGNGTFVAVGENGIILTSPDGVAWTERTSGLVPYNAYLCEAAYGNGAFVAVGNYGTILTSPDGMTWTQRLATANLSGVIYGNGTFIAVGQYGTILESDQVATALETISTPNIPGNDVINGTSGISYTFSTGGSISNLGHSIEYRFDWGDGTNSGWLSENQASASKSWDSPGGYLIRVQARCAIDNSVVSSWSSGLTVNITAPITLQSPPDSTPFDACSLYSAPTFSWTAGETFKGYEIQFSPDQDFNSIPVKIKTSTITNAITSNTWKKVLLIAGSPGEIVYWRVVGTRSDRSTSVSEVRSFILEDPESVGNPAISPMSKVSLPVLSWRNNCNNKFKVWFGSNGSFIKKTGYSFNIKNPNDNEGRFVKSLTSGQWKAIKKLVGDTSGSTIYWYVESWDALGRYAKTELMSFVLAD